MGFYRNRLYPRLVHALGNPKPIREIRQRIIPRAQGKVLEIGAGSGANFEHYDPARVCTLCALEPNPGMIRLADRQRRKTKLDVEFLKVPGEDLALDDQSVDTVVTTFTLCTIDGVVEALYGMRRVLRPNGLFIFFEHGLSPEPRVQRWQRRWEPIHRRVFLGCHLTRDIPSLLVQAGFRIEHMEQGYLAAFPKSWTYCWWGTAVPSYQ
jgi:SAM-dependent methyltransferase